MKKILLTAVIALSLFSLNAKESITNKTFEIIKTTKGQSFIENKGQFDEFETNSTGKVLYAVDFGSTRIFFGEKGISYNFLEAIKKSRKEREEIMKQESKSFEDHKRKEKLVGKFMFRNDEVGMIWKNSLPTVKLTGFEETPDYHSYYFKGASGEYENINHVKGFKKIKYENIYPNIDLTYEIHPVSGVKYAFIVHPGADPSQIKMVYDRDISLQNGKIHIPTQFGDIIDHAPVSFYENNEQNIIPSNFAMHNNTVKFKIADYNPNKTLIIDPWTQTPTFNLNWQNVWELDRDAAGNVYIIGGIMPMQLLKYDFAGNLQWTYNTPYDTANNWLGTLSTDLAGNSYVTSGSTARLQKINTSGGLVWNNNGFGGTLGNSDEFWTITFNCDQSRLVIGGTNGAFNLPPVLEAAIFQVNTTNGAFIASEIVAKGSSIGIPPPMEEVRAICPSKNGRYYFITHDTIGYIFDDLNFCSNSANRMLTNDHGMGLGYKCENYRYDNTGIRAIRTDDNFLYVHRGNQLQKRRLTDFSIVATVAIPSGGFNNVFLGGNQVANSGIDIDQCGNIYVGSGTRVVKFNSNLNQLDVYTLPYNVYDVRVSINGNVIACGGTGTASSSNRSGGVSSIVANACAPLTIECCNASICQPEEFCQSDAPVNLVTATPGGTWSGPGVNASGTFNPSVAGPGLHTIIYTLPCGSDSIRIAVSSCLPIDVCVETNGNLTANGAVAPITWEYWRPAQTVSTNTQAQCQACGYTWSFGNCTSGGFFPAPSTCTIPAQWVVFATGQTVAPPPNFPIRVSDAIGDFVEINSISDIPDCSTVTCPTITVSITAQNNVTCNGGNNGSATVSASGGNGTITYTWQPGNLNGATQNNLSAATYTVTATDIDGCTGNTTVNINQPTAIQFTTSSSASACNVNNGSATINPSGGSGSYTYTWSPNVSSGNTATGLAAGNYAVTVNDGNCEVNTSIIVNASQPPVINNISSTAETCLGDNDGTATVSASGGTGTLNYNWSNGTSTATISGLTPGSYSVTVTDANGCTAISSVSVADGPTCCELNVTAASTAPNCNTADGTITLNILSGSGNYSFTWSNGAISQNLLGVASGTYTVTVTDLNIPGGTCTFDTTIVLNDLNGPVIDNISSTAETCLGANDGTVTIAASGGTGALSYVWSNGAITPVVSNLSPGNYSVTVSDENGCNASSSVVVAAGPDCCTFTMAFTTTSSSCNNSDGEVTLNINNGSGNYSFTWSTGAITPNLNGIAAGSYSVTVTDNGVPGICQKDTIITINDLDGPVIDNIVVVNESCENQNDGSLEAVASGGTGTLNYSWSNGANVAQISALSPGSYQITVTDGVGCTTTSAATVVAGGPCCTLGITALSVTNETCDGTNGTAEVAVNTNIPEIEFLWSNGATTSGISGLSAGTYSVTITNPLQANCSVDTFLTITNTPAPIIDNLLIENESCFELGDGSAEAFVSGGNPPYTYTWNNVVGNSIRTSLFAGTYTLSISDQNCTVTETFEILPGINVEVSAGNDTSVYAGTVLQLNGSVNGGTTGSFVWTPGSTLSCSGCQNPIATPQTTTTYSVFYTDDLGCTDSDDILIAIIQDEPYCLFPDAFTPNGDNINDYFKGICDGMDYLELRVYNRWGELVYEEMGINIQGWDGVYKGRKSPMDVYVYAAYIEYTNGRTESIIGNVTLIR
jgi:gliding motility-associated-like protein